MLYSTSISEIISFKSQRWSTVNYGLLLYAAIISLHQFLKEPHWGELVVFNVMNLMILLVGCHALKTLTASICVRDNRLVGIRQKHTERFRTVWASGYLGAVVDDTPNKPIKLTRMFYAIFLLGFVITLWVVNRSYLLN